MPDPHGFDAAIAFHRAHETDWPRSMYLPDGRYIGTAAIGDRPEFAAVIGPVRPRGEPNGLVLRGGQAVAEWGDTTRPDMTFSVAKSYLALLAGLAVSDGLIADLDASVGRDVPGPWFATPHNAHITWRHLLQQTSEWQGELWGKPDIADHNRVVGGPAEKLAAAKGEVRELAEPGRHFEYNDVRVNLLAACLTHVFGRDLPAVLRERIMDPIGASASMGVARLHRRRAGDAGPYAGLRVGRRPLGRWPVHLDARPRADGPTRAERRSWAGRQLIPQSWIDTMLEPSPRNDQYGLLWWLNSGAQPLFPSAPRDSVFALGAGRSLIWIAPSLDLVAVLRWIDRDHTDGLLGALSGAEISSLDALVRDVAVDDGDALPEDVTF